MNEKYDIPEWKDYGSEFNYAQWTANTVISLHNVNWDNSYRDTTYFDGGHNELNTWLDKTGGPSTTIRNATYHRPGQPIRLGIPFGKALNFNYLRAYNYAQPGQSGDTGRYYYYFVTAVNHINPGVTEFVLQLDVFQTFIYQTSLASAYIMQSHAGIANVNAFADNGRDFLTVPEGLDVGNEYEIAAIFRRNIASARNGKGFSIMVVSTVAIDEDPGTVDDPKLKTATGNALENLPNGTEAYVFQDVQKYREFLEAFSDKPWITQGIVSVTAIPPNMAVEYGMKGKSKVIAGQAIIEIQPGSLNTLTKLVANNWRALIRQMLPSKYKHLDKFLVYPYCVIEMTANTGTPLVLKPEAMPGQDLYAVEVPHFAQPGPRIMFYPYRYNARQESEPSTDQYGVVLDGGEGLDMATGIFNFPTFSIPNNSYIGFMASNLNSINYQHTSADWSQQRALAGSDLAATQATAGIGLANTQNQIGLDTARAQTSLGQQTAIMQGVLGGATGMIGAGSPGAMIGAAANAVAGTAIAVNQSEQSYNINAGQMRQQNAAQTGNMAFNRDTNQEYAQYAARGDYQNTIAGINAKVQDAKMIQPTTSGQVGGEAFLLASDKWGYDFKIKMLQGAAIARLGDYWLRYGYAVQRFGNLPRNFKAMTHFTYWKLSETYLAGGDMPEQFRGTIRGIFEKGVTVWTKPEYIGRMHSVDNKPLEGIVL